MALTTLSAVKAQLGIGTTTDDSLLTTYVDQASQLIETHCRRAFTESIGTLRYDARPPRVTGRVLYLDTDVLGVVSITNGADGTLQPTDYRLLPNNYSPKYAIELLPSSGRAWSYSAEGDSQASIVVVGTLGYCTAATRPADITLAATKLAAWLYQNRDNDGAVIRLADGTTQIPAEAPNLVVNLISRYVRLEALG